jgi:hypothetical protein
LLLIAGAGSPVAADTYDFGAIPVGENAGGTFSITNDWSMPIEVNLTITESNSQGYSLDPATPLTSTTIEVPAGGTMPFEIVFAPTEEGVEYTASFTAVYGWTTLMTLELAGVGAAPAPVDQTSKMEPIVLGNCNTGIMDREYCDGMLSESIEECIASMDYHGSALRCLGKLSRELHQQKILNRTEIKSLQRCAAKALIEQHKENQKNWYQQKKDAKKKRWDRHSRKTKHSHYKLGWHRR